MPNLVMDLRSWLMMRSFLCLLVRRFSRFNMLKQRNNDVVLLFTTLVKENLVLYYYCFTYFRIIIYHTYEITQMGIWHTMVSWFFLGFLFKIVLKESSCFHALVQWVFSFSLSDTTHPFKS